MKTIFVGTARSYTIKIGSGLLAATGQEVRALGGVRRVCVVSDSNVWPLYGEAVKQSLENSGFYAFSYVFPAGEQSKNGQTYLSLLQFLAENGLTRQDLLLALGGGVVGDLTGFAAATYLRGIRYIQVPTTVLSAVDSSVGGKTAIDLPAGKNLCGAFYQPSLVLCDTDTLNSLPPDIFRDGCAEVIKYGILYDEAFFAYLEQTGTAFDRERVIARCVELKRDVVLLDEQDNGARRMLNLGHTIGHALEARSGFALSHGQAVAIGMAVVARGTHCPDTRRILDCLRRFGLPTAAAYPAEELLPYTLSDKKRQENAVALIVPRRVGHCEIVPTPVTELKKLMQEGL